MHEVIKAAESDIDVIVGLADRAGLALWSRDDYAEAANSRDRLLLAARENAVNVVGFILVQLLCASGDAVDVEILNIAVDPRFKRKGIGRRLLATALEMIPIDPDSKVLLEVRASNLSAIAFYRRYGFHEQAVRRAYYRDPTEDAILFGADAEKVLTKLKSASDLRETIN
ncbi:MAG: ribosomal protein S18-alanine N-acetyltransferase [Acidobacteria bacterium]|nr:ribosomal protein S18-alanine N-acetyltransferase [Acidobacteriota bacterium]